MKTDETRNSFTFYLSFERAISNLDDKNQLIVYRSISRYSLFGEEPQVEGLALVAWELIKPILEKSRILSVNGKQAKGIEKPSLLGNQNAKTKQNQSQNEAKTVRDRDRDRDKKKNIKEKATRFSPPTLEEVKAYCQERKNDINSERFIDFYQSKNWMIGKNKMKDWKAAIRNWERNEKKGGNNESVQEYIIPD